MVSTVLLDLLAVVISCHIAVPPMEYTQLLLYIGILLIVTSNKGQRATSHVLLCIAIGDHNNDLKAMQDVLCK